MGRLRVSVSPVVTGDQEPHRRRPLRFPTEPGSYTFLARIGEGTGTVIFKATCDELESTIVAIKTVDLEHPRSDLDSLRRETIFSHPNILTRHCAFGASAHLWIVMPFMSGGSLHTLLPFSFPSGLSEPIIAHIMKETLQGLCYLHGHPVIHGDVKPNKILVDMEGNVKLAISDHPRLTDEHHITSSTSHPDSEFVIQSAYWVPPETMRSERGYESKRDIWALGITAMELIHARPPISHLGLSQFLARTTDRLRFYTGESTIRSAFSEELRDLVAACLVEDPSQRPSAQQLLRHPFIVGHTGSQHYLASALVRLPSLEERVAEMERDQRRQGEDWNRPAVPAPAASRRVNEWRFVRRGLIFHPVFAGEQETANAAAAENRRPASMGSRR